MAKARPTKTSADGKPLNAAVSGANNYSSSAKTFAEILEQFRPKGPEDSPLADITFF